jgi:hypothetical protein
MLVPSLAANGLPSLTVLSPSDNALFSTSNIEIKGSSAGSNRTWNETSASDFGRGSFCSTEANPNGTVSLANGTYDDFDDNTIDELKWSVTKHIMVDVSEENGALRFCTSGYPATSGVTRATATARAGDRLHADLDFKSPLDITSTSSVGFDIDLDASHYIHIWFGLPWGEPVVRIFYAQDGYPMSAVAKFGSSQNTISVVFSLNRVEINVSDVLWLDEHMDYRQAAVSLFGAAYYANSVEAAWDNLSLGRAFDGTFISAVKDTGSELSHLKSCDWTGKVPSGTGIRLQYRSSGDPAMANSSAWTDISAGKVSRTVVLKRYFQYRALLSTADPLITPYLDNVGFTYNIPVERVELSIDGGNSWTKASGTDKWSAKLNLPENRSQVLVQAIDYAGEIASSSIGLDVDLTNPTGSVKINNGAEITDSLQVNLSLDAADRYGVAMMRLSEDPDLSAATWVPFSRRMPFQLSDAEGNKTVYAQFRDTAGWTSDVVQDSIFLDYTLPTGAIDINGGAKYTLTTRVWMNLTAYDLQGVDSMQLSNDAAFTGVQWQQFKSQLDWNLLPGNGERTVYARFRTASLQTSALYSDSIILDTSPPSVNVTINDGATITASPSVRLKLQATDNDRVAQAQVTENPSFEGGTTMAFSPDVSYELSPGDGEKTLFVRVWDAAGNEFRTVGARMVLDTTPPIVQLAPVPSTQESLSILISWDGSDLLTGVSSYDLQYNAGLDWINWLSGLRTNSSRFTGKEGTSYLFRVRATDGAGNTCQYVEGGPVTVVKPDLRLPLVAITAPSPGSVMKGAIEIKGTSNHPVAGKTVQNVQVQIDDGDWQNATGTLSWAFSLDTRTLAEGGHTVRARAYDGRAYSYIAELSFTAKNLKPAKTGGESPWMMLVIMLVVVVAGFAGIIAIRKLPIRPTLVAGSLPPVESSGPPSNPTLPPMEPVASKDGLVVSKISVKDLEDEPEPVPVSEEPVPEQEGAPAEIATIGARDPIAAREGRALKALSSLPRGLPSSLWGQDLDDLASNVVSGERKDSPEGDLIVKIGSRWYYGDETNPGLFMQEYKQ